MTRGTEQALIVAGLLILLGALAILPDWKATFGMWVEMIKHGFSYGYR